MSIAALHHVSFTVSNLAEAERFFINLLGMQRLGGGIYDFDYIAKQVGFADAVLKISVLCPPGDSAMKVELIEYVHPRGEAIDTSTHRPGNAHLCLLVDDIDSEYARLRSAGVRFKSAPNLVTFGINKGAKAVYFNGPDGIALELFQPAPSTVAAESAA